MVLEKYDSAIVKLLFLTAMLIIPAACVQNTGNKNVNQNPGPVAHSMLWSEDEINDWYEELPWLFGTNFIPSTAINPIEMWQEDTFDPATIDRELGFARNTGMNSVRVFLHYLVWKEEGSKYLDRIDHFLQLAKKNEIAVMFVLFDDCWNPDPVYGKQIDPVPFLHNSGWSQCPGLEILMDTIKHAELESYVTEIIGNFANDDRVIVWDLYNEPGNTNSVAYADPESKPLFSMILLKKVFLWARNQGPVQPLTTGVWTGDWSDPDSLTPLNRYSLEHSDLISFHCYHDIDGFIQFYEPLKRYGRPVFCTEFMSRGSGGRFESILPYMKQNHIAGYNWGLVNGKTQTIYSWESWTRDISSESEFWHHDILHPDGTPYLKSEIELFLEMRNMDNQTKTRL